MPLARIDIPAGRPSKFASDLSEAVQQSLHDAFGVPMEEKFHIITDHGPGHLMVDPSYLGVMRSKDAIVIQVVLNRGRDAAKKQRFYATLAAEAQSRVGLRPQDLVINLIEVGREDWSFGDGQAQLVESSDGARAPNSNSE